MPTDGAVTSTVHVYEALPTLPPLSVASTSRVCEPSVSPSYVPPVLPHVVDTPSSVHVGAPNPWVIVHANVADSEFVSWGGVCVNVRGSSGTTCNVTTTWFESCQTWSRAWNSMVWVPTAGSVNTVGDGHSLSAPPSFEQ